MNNEPLISVIVPVYNVEKYLGQCLDSIINQTLKDIEIICVDDGSTDGSLDILNSYKEKDDRIIILKQKNLYAGVARNNGLKVAKGKYLSFLDSDDFFDANMLEDMYNQAEKDKSDVVVCNFCEYNTNTKETRFRVKIKNRFIAKSPFSPKDIINDIFIFGGLNAWSKLFRRQLFIDNDLHFEPCACCNDFTCVCTAMAACKKISILEKPYVHYRINQSSNITAKRNKSVDSFFFAAQRLQDNLKNLHLYDTFKQAFATTMKLSFRWELSFCNQNQKEEKKAAAKNILSNELYNILYNEPLSIPIYRKPQKRSFIRF